MKILTVEDNEINAMLMDRVVKELDFVKTHDTVADGEEAFSKAKEEKYDLVLMDINLGDGKIDGVEVMKVLRTSNTYQSVPFFAITCYSLPGDKERFLEQGFDEYFPKPLDHKALLDKIRSYNQAST